jgi:hypothetical protein
MPRQLKHFPEEFTPLPASLLPQLMHALFLLVAPATGLRALKPILRFTI